MQRMRWVLGVVLIASNLFAQEKVVSATNPPSLKWYQVNTSHFRILYPKGFDGQAQRMANTLESIREPESKTIGSLPKKISVILQNQSSISNAFVTMTPRRAEFYAMPTQNYNFSGNNDWLNMLATHEYRHIAQFQHARRGFSKLLGYAFGYNVFAGLTYVAAPQWFWEGDAVATETAFTQSGRGRIPNFDLLMRTNLQEGRVFNYHKQYLESYKNKIPNWYVLGYHMVSYLRKKTNDPQIWDKVTARSWSVPFIPFRFSSALKKETGLTVTALYREMAADLQKQYKAQQDTLKLTSFETVNHRTSEAYTDFLYPHELEDGSVVARRVGIGDIEKLVVFKNGTEQSKYTQGIINESGMQTATNSRVVWNEFRYDPRWQVKNFSVVVGYDLVSRQKTVLGVKSRYASAAISPNGYQVATIETTTEYQTHLVILDYFSGRVLKTFDNPNNDFISMPRFTTDGKNIVALLTNTKGKAMVQFNVASGGMKPLTDFSNENIGHPVPFGKYIIYNSPISGIDNIYALDTLSGERYQITCSKYGSYNPSISRDGKWIYYNEQGRNGMDIAKIPVDPNSWRPWKWFVQPGNTFKHLVEQEGEPSVLNNIPQTQYDTKRYYRWKGLINPYSWGGTVSTSLTSAFVGISSQDLLSTTLLSAGYVYNKTERAGSWLATVSYQGWFPIIDVSASVANRNVNQGDITTVTQTGTPGNYTSTVQDKNLNFKWQENTIEAGLRVPLITTTSKYYGNVTVGNSIGITQVTNFRNSITTAPDRIFPAYIRNDTVYGFYSFFNRVGNGNVVFNNFSISGYRLLKQSPRDINSKWGQEFFLNAYNTPYGGDYSGSQFSFYGVLFFPGLFKHHSLWGYWGYQHTLLSNVYRDATRKGIADNHNYVFQNGVPAPRGLTISRFSDFYSMSANYTLPVWYPDIAVGPLLNIQRMRVNGFLDYGFGQGSINNPTTTQAYTSTGVEVKFDINVMRLLPQLDVGFRYSMGIQPATTLFEVLIGTINF
ncbi:MAG: hypothetical protein OJF59_002476 [Cytophagales bacterium]|jgi:hypothetical protein|nr:hypothetical protein [Bacteroidota bacterium]MBS1980204.1 hypothetical protein [Bacteroidota bacterium]WHZ08722.1 MAG: hypothetical protein OJF59_002476 [Cytophagales bacterium]